MNPNLLSGLIAGASALMGSIIGGLFAMWTATRAHTRQLQIQQTQLRGQSELKARELMFGLYQQKMKDFSEEIKGLGAVVGKLGAALNLPDIGEEEKTEAMLAFVATVRPLTDPIMEILGDIENELRNLGLRDKWALQLGFVKEHLTPDLDRATPEQIYESYQNLTRALTYITQIQHSLVERRSEELFSEYLPSKSVQKQ